MDITSCNTLNSYQTPESKAFPSFAAPFELWETPSNAKLAQQRRSSPPTRCVATSMFEVPLDRPSSSSAPEGSSFIVPPEFIFSRDPSSLHTSFHNSQDTRSKRNGRRRSRARLPLCLLQGSNQTGGGLFLSTIGATGLPVTRSGGLQGPGGVCMALVVALVAVVAAFKRRLFISSNQHQKLCCSMCNGFGVLRCDLCKGRGIVEWEGKLWHSDPCPSCFGSCHMKCSSCDGRQVKKMKKVSLLQLPQSMANKNN